MESIFVWGLNHRSDSVEARERLMRALGASGEGSSLPPLPLGDEHESVLLSTCNRIEIYGVTERDMSWIWEDLTAELSRLGGMDATCLQTASYLHQGSAAGEHLFRVATGLDSLVLGESQILHQVKRAKEQAEAQDTIGPVLHQLFRQAIRLGKRARTETDINRYPVSMASIGVDQAEQRLGSLVGRTALIVGAGKIGGLAARRLNERGVQEVRLANRSRETADSLLASYNATFWPLDDLPSALEDVDLVISASGSPRTLVDRSHVDEARSAEDCPPSLVIVDLALPRDVEANVAQRPDVELHNVDDLQDIVQAHRERRQAEVEPIGRMIAAEVDRFDAWLKERDAASLIRALRDRAEAIRDDELQSTLRRLQLDDPDQEALVEQLSRRLMNKLLHDPTTRIKDWVGNDHGLDRDAIAALFGVQDSEQSEQSASRRAP
ncbi:MAG: glutamyl-tRNA reductase [Candidatus Bipolaricaulia bacterium]